MPAYGYNPLDFTITNGTSVSNKLQLNGLHLDGIILPAAWTAAGLSFLGCETLAGTFLPLVDALGNEITLTIVAGRHILMPMSMIRGVNFLQLQSGTSAAPVNQGADRAIRCLARAYE